MKICFYTCGNPILGMGHIYRALVLAKMAARDLGWLVSFALKNHTEGIAVIAQYDFPLEILNDGDLPGGEWDVVVVDQLDIDVSEIKALKSRSRFVVSLDDTGPGHYETNLAFNALYRCKATRPDGSLTNSLFGFDYLVIDPAFAEQSYVLRDQVKNVFLTQGGSDTYGVVSQLVDTLSPWLDNYTGINLHVHTGPAFRFDANLETSLGHIKSPTFWHQNISDMAGLFGKMDIAISAGGMMACELAATGIPLILVTAEEKELETTAEFAAKEIAVVLGKYSKNIDGPLYSELDRLVANVQDRERLSSSARQNIDGTGATRILSKIKELL